MQYITSSRSETSLTISKEELALVLGCASKDHSKWQKLCGIHFALQDQEVVTANEYSLIVLRSLDDHQPSDHWLPNVTLGRSLIETVLKVMTRGEIATITFNFDFVKISTISAKWEIEVNSDQILDADYPKYELITKQGANAGSKCDNSSFVFDPELLSGHLVRWGKLTGKYEAVKFKTQGGQSDPGFFTSSCDKVNCHSTFVLMPMLK